MTAQKDLKAIVRARMAQTGETYTAARAAFVYERDLALTTSSREVIAPATPIDAIVLKVNHSSARLRVVGETDAITFRGDGVHGLVPGHLATITIVKRWPWRKHSYATGEVIGARIDIATLGLEPLPLEDQGLYDLHESSEPFRSPDPYAPMWRKFTRPVRRAFEFHALAWEGPDGNAETEVYPVLDAAELREAGDDVGALEGFMDVLAKDLRCLDAHAHLGNMLFDRRPQDALVHYAVGIGIGDLSLGTNFRDMLPWGFIYNRPFLRCLHGYGLSLWRLGRGAEAASTFERILALNPTDNQGVRFCLNDVRAGRSWTPDEEEVRPLAEM